MTATTLATPAGPSKRLAVSPARALNGAYAFFERNWNLTRRYAAWELVWLVYSLANALTILFIAAATERITGQRVDTGHLVLYLLIGTIVWSYLSAVFDIMAETIAYERWEGTIEYTLMAPVPRFVHLLGTCAFGITYAALRGTIMFAVIVLIFGIDLSRANFASAALVGALGSVSVVGLAIFVGILPLLFTERGTQMTFVIHSTLLLVSGIYYPVDVLPEWLRIASPLSPITYVLEGVRAAVLEGAPLGAVAPELLVLAAMGVVLVPAGMAAFGAAERYAKRTGKLKRSG